jgi:DNA-binding Lrp family transcriptional regulator
MAGRLGVSEERVLETLRSLCERGAVSRVGPVFRPNRVGASTLAAMAVPETELERVAELVNSWPEVNHNYQREHRFNLWFVATAASRAELDAVLSGIAEASGLKVMDLPMLEDYHIDLGFELVWA